MLVVVKGSSCLRKRGSLRKGGRHAVFLQGVQLVLRRIQGRRCGTIGRVWDDVESVRRCVRSAGEPQKKGMTSDAPDLDDVGDHRKAAINCLTLMHHIHIIQVLTMTRTHTHTEQHQEEEQEQVQQEQHAFIKLSSRHEALVKNKRKAASFNQ